MSQMDNNSVIVVYKGDTTSLVVHKESTDYISSCITRTKKFYEALLLSYLQEHYREQKTIIDIGANIGNHTVFFAKYMDCKTVISFEPFRKNFELLQQNTTLYQDKCRLYENALSSSYGIRQLYCSEPQNFGGISLEKEEKSELVHDNVFVYPLDMFKFEEVTMIKIDVENHEHDVLIGAIDTINKYKPIIILENSHHYFKNLFTDPEPHKAIMEDLHYVKKASNVCGSSMDLWVPDESCRVGHALPMKKPHLIPSYSYSYSSNYAIGIIGFLYITLFFLPV